MEKIIIFAHYFMIFHESSHSAIANSFCYIFIEDIIDTLTMTRKIMLLLVTMTKFHLISVSLALPSQPESLQAAVLFLSKTRLIRII